MSRTVLVNNTLDSLSGLEVDIVCADQLALPCVCVCVQSDGEECVKGQSDSASRLQPAELA